MSELKKSLLIRILPQTDLGRSVASFLADRQARGLSPHTVDFYAAELHYLQAYLEKRGISSVQDTSPDLLRRYLLDIGRHRNPGGVHVAYRAMRAFEWYMVEYEPTDWSNPIVKVAAPRVLFQALEPVSLSDLRAMLGTCKRHAFTGDRDRALLLALLDTGCRASEFVALNVLDVNMTIGAVIIRSGKGGKFRTAFVGASTRREVLRYLRHRTEETGPLWVTPEGARITYWGLRSIVRRRARCAGVDAPSLHSFRRGFAITSLRNGVDVFSLQRLMGHSDLSILRRYLTQTDADLEQAHRRAGPVDNTL